jgi:hypothetical protein
VDDLVARREPHAGQRRIAVARTGGFRQWPGRARSTSGRPGQDGPNPALLRCH